MDESRARVVEGDLLTLVEADVEGRKYLAKAVRHDTHKIKGIGIVNTGNLIGSEYGLKVKLGAKEFYVLPASAVDKYSTVRRKAQIILPKDAAQIIHGCGITAGCRVLESGIGSGALTISLAQAVAPGGKVVSYEIREDFMNWAKENLESAGLDKLVEFNLRDVTKGMDERNLDAVILDVPSPADAVEHAWNALRPGGYLCTYSPLISQVEAAVSRMRALPFIEIMTVENIQREMVVGERGTRPSFDMLGHTGYITFARKVCEMNKKPAGTCGDTGGKKGTEISGRCE
ncbi:MAG: tRNA (adenine-N1)-methyltransferase [Thermoplasmata archaeon HGW-Thermoplasmata-1]|nr:MAG: tRNA (adenine-N1)-methyltransferase [Thermoplasmata archaeon HGW-Thermoplasmata-1]